MYPGPYGGTLLAGVGTDISAVYQQSNEEIRASWDVFVDPESEVTALNWCAGSSPQKCDIVYRKALPIDAKHVNYVLLKPMLNGQRYFITVQCTNGAGVVATLVSNGVTVDITPPKAGVVIDGKEMDSEYFNAAEEVTASWSKFLDTESGIESYAVAVCSAFNQSSCPLKWSSLQNATTVKLTGIISF